MLRSRTSLDGSKALEFTSATGEKVVLDERVIIGIAPGEVETKCGGSPKPVSLIMTLTGGVFSSNSTIEELTEFLWPITNDLD